MKKRFLSIVAIIAALTLCLCACGGGEKDTFKITVLESEHGVISVDKTKAKAGDLITVTATPDAGYYLSSLTLNGLPTGTVFVMPSAVVVLQGTFELASSPAYAIVLDSSVGGTVTADVLNAKEGDTVTLTVTPDPLYDLNLITVNGTRIEGTSFTMPEEDAIIYVEFVKDGTFYSVTAENSRYGVVTADCEQSRAGGTVTLDYFPVAGYVLDYFTLNGTRLDANTFVMPKDNVTVSAVFRSVFDGASITVASAMASNTAYSHWMFEAQVDGLHVTVKVMDSVIITSNELQYHDYVELMVHNLAYGNAWERGKTLKLTVTADGATFVRTALAENSLSNLETDYDVEWSATVEHKQVVHKDGYTGYEVTMLIPYEIVGLTAQTAAGNMAVCPAMNNAESVVTWNWESYANSTWFSPATYLVVRNNGTVS